MLLRKTENLNIVEKRNETRQSWIMVKERKDRKCRNGERKKEDDRVDVGESKEQNRRRRVQEKEVEGK